MTSSADRGLVVGLTGGIACGKSTVARLLADQGAHVISADEVGHWLLKKGSPVYAELIASFGRDLLEPSGDISRAKLAAVVFRDPAARERLNAIMHPIIIRESLQAAHRHVTGEEGSSRVAVIDAPLLFEAGMEDHVDVVVVVKARESTQIARMLARAAAEGRAMTEAEARARIASQMAVCEKARRANFVIDNDQKRLDELREEVGRLWDMLRQTHRRKKNPPGGPIG